MAGIPGIPGGAEPSFRTGERGWLSLDDLVREVVAWLQADGVELSPFVVKVTVQNTRALVHLDQQWPGEALFEAVHLHTRRSGVLLRADQVERIVRAYAALVAILDIQDIHELGV